MGGKSNCCAIVAPLETLREIENRYNYISLKKELERKARWGGKSNIYIFIYIYIYGGVIICIGEVVSLKRRSVR